MPTPTPSIMAPGGGPDGRRSTTSSGGGLRFGGDVSTLLVGGVSTFLFSGSVGGTTHGQVGPSATLVGCSGGGSAAFGASARLRTRSCMLSAVAARSLFP